MLEIVLTREILGPPKSGALGLSLFSLMVNPWLVLVTHAAERPLPELEVNIWRFIAVLLLRNEDQENNPLASFAICLWGQRIGHEGTAHLR